MKSRFIFSSSLSLPTLGGYDINIGDWYEKRKNDVLVAYTIGKDGLISYCFIWGVEMVKCGDAQLYKIIYENNKEDVFVNNVPSFVSDCDGNPLSFIRRISEKSIDGLEGYEMYFEGGVWKFTHRMVAGNHDKSMVVHHIDGNKRNNMPSNLMVMKKGAHVKMHENERENNDTTPDMFGRQINGVNVSMPNSNSVLNDRNVKIKYVIKYDTAGDWTEKHVYSFSADSDNVAISNGLFAKLV